MSKRILMVLTSNDRLGDSGKPTGTWAEELAEPYYAFTDAGIVVAIASTAGGRAPIDPGSLKAPGDNERSVERMLADESLQRMIGNTRPLGEFDMNDFVAVFFAGGHGTMWDFPDSPDVKRTVEAAYARKKIVAAVCHGVAGLVPAVREDGKPLVQGKRISSFTDAEEDAAGTSSVVPFKLESRLRELGAAFEGAENWRSFAVQDGFLVTGQNPQSAQRVAELVLHALGH